MADNVRAIDAVWPTAQHKFALLPDNIGADVPSGIADLVSARAGCRGSRGDRSALSVAASPRRRFNIDVLTPVARLAGQRIWHGCWWDPGTPAFSAAIELALHPIKPRKLLGICQFPTFRHAMQAQYISNSIPRRWNCGS